MVDGHERIAVADGDHGRQVDPAQIARPEERPGSRCPSTIARSSSPPGARAPAPRRDVGPGRPRSAGPSGGRRSGSISRRATLARGSRWVVIPATTSVRRRSGWRAAKCERGHRAHREAHEVERFKVQRVGEASEVRRRGGRTRSRRARPSASSRGRARRGGRDGMPGRTRHLGRPVLASRRTGAVQHDQRRAGAVRLVADVGARWLRRTTSSRARHRSGHRQTSGRPSSSVASACSIRRYWRR